MFRNISLKTQLGVGFSLVVAIFLAVLMVVAMLLNRLDQGVVRVSEESLPLMLAVDQMDLARSEVQQFLTDVSATHDPAAYAEAAESAKNFHDGAAAFRRFFEHSGDQNRLAQLAAVEASFDAFYASGKAMAEAYLNQGLEAGNLLMKGSPGQPGFDQASEDLSQRLSAFRDQQLQLTRRDTEDDRAAATTMQHAMLWGGLAATLVAIAAAGLIVRAILNQFGAEPRVVVKFVQRIGTGNLSTPIHVRPGDQDSLMAQLQTMQHNLRDVVATVREKAQIVERASVDIESGSADLSGRTAGQAASLEETAASMEELNARVRQNLDGARHAEQLAASASTSAKQGGELVAQFVDTMQGINEASRKIAEIIGVIDGIAFQTNILALNAAVEAARAGEQGRGFAVVASEVRTLAGRSAEAAKAIKVLIGDSVARVDDGSALVARARSAMTTVVEDIRQVSQAMGDITTASAEQSASVAQVSESVHRMDQVTQQNAALVDASATSAMDLRRQAHELTEAMAVFTLSPDATAPSAVAAHSGAEPLPVGAPA